ncbi:NADH-quinone oxidoreductase subunit C [Streptomyces griseiscabiei]|uniref:NADH-quinone oxidoreductase subunit C n=2 Tax=Streptomyces griseiscabiei TaxID=2993540 RepID=A0ABU4LCN6_9ACTN|nr:NADH-quinone oxidoreductase subunit C [Streptomyces griseiscabiei]MBZ3907306.1 NADH-quinone oxidoreductase subunit C [Streptomyces griseiscabiei]MDX2913398.1 NADH-quinone oxidoreductase subunit C [Streptomyces griseiscabiei]
MTTGWLPAPAEELFGPESTADESYGVLTVDVPPASWTEALRTARSTLGCTYFDWLSAVDEPGTGFRVAAHVVALSPVRRLLLRTTVPHDTPVLPTAVDVYAGAAWHERETHEMFGVRFEGHPALDHLLLPENFEGHPLRKDFVLAARVAKAWPGAKEPGESEHGGPRRRQMLPPGVPDPNDWGPLKGQLPPAPARPSRATPPGARPTRRPTTDPTSNPPRRSRSASEGSATQPPPAATTPTDPAAPGASPSPRRTRSAAEGSASQTSPAPTTPADPPAPGASPSPRRTRSAAEGSASQSAPGATPDTPAPPRRTRSAASGSASQRETPTGTPAAPEPQGAERQTGTPEVQTGSAESSGAAEPSPRPRPARPTARSADAPWHHARPAFDEPEPQAEAEPQREAQPQPQREAEPGLQPEPKAEPTGQPGQEHPTTDSDTAPAPPDEDDAPQDSHAPPTPEAPTTDTDTDTPRPPAGGTQ